jgi:hypothetical protein
MDITHGFFGRVPYDAASVVGAMKRFSGALGFECRSRTDNELQLERHRWLKDRLVISFGAADAPDEATHTKIQVCFQMNGFRHPYSRGRPMLDVTRMRQAIFKHIGQAVSSAPYASAE